MLLEQIGFTLIQSNIPVMARRSFSEGGIRGP